MSHTTHARGLVSSIEGLRHKRQRGGIWAYLEQKVHDTREPVEAVGVVGKGVGREWSNESDGLVAGLRAISDRW